MEERKGASGATIVADEIRADPLRADTRKYRRGRERRSVRYRRRRWRQRGCNDSHAKVISFGSASVRARPRLSGEIDACVVVYLSRGGTIWSTHRHSCRPICGAVILFFSETPACLVATSRGPTLFALPWSVRPSSAEYKGERSRSESCGESRWIQSFVFARAVSSFVYPIIRSVWYWGFDYYNQQQRLELNARGEGGELARV